MSCQMHLATISERRCGVQILRPPVASADELARPSLAGVARICILNRRFGGAATMDWRFAAPDRRPARSAAQRHVRCLYGLSVSALPWGVTTRCLGSAR